MLGTADDKGKYGALGGFVCATSFIRSAKHSSPTLCHECRKARLKPTYAKSFLSSLIFLFNKNETASSEVCRLNSHASLPSMYASNPR